VESCKGESDLRQVRKLQGNFLLAPQEGCSFFPSWYAPLRSFFLSFLSLLTPFVFITPALCVCVCVCSRARMRVQIPSFFPVNSEKCKGVILLPGADANAKTNWLIWNIVNAFLSNPSCRACNIRLVHCSHLSSSFLLLQYTHLLSTVPDCQIC
jgi:hypothetical protein